ncbi:MAG: hypothetical protein ACHQ50_13135 [Fimbriimonadales bacterium]
MAWKEKTIISARELLEHYLEFNGLTPNKENWSEKSLATNPPRLVRFQRLVALFKAFGIETEVSSFHKGEFIDVKNPAYRPLLVRIRSEVDDEVIAQHLDPQSQQHWADLRHVFEQLLAYRVRLRAVLDFSGGVLEATPLYYYAHQKIGEINRAIRPHLGIVEDLLVELISPTDAKFDVTDLARDFGYPLVDLSDLDLDWW